MGLFLFADLLQDLSTMSRTIETLPYRQEDKLAGNLLLSIRQSGVHGGS